MQPTMTDYRGMRHIINGCVLISTLLMGYALYWQTQFTTMMLLEGAFVDVLKSYFTRYESYHYLIRFKNLLFFIRLLCLFGMIMLLLYIDKLSKMQAEVDTDSQSVITRRIFRGKLKIFFLFILLCGTVFI